jgi:deazaflavin-dependent oxidoreductase (nitroreductase family)
MAKTYKVTPIVRFINKIMGWAIRMGYGPERSYLLTVKGRKSGRLYTTPVSLIIDDNDRLLVSPYGVVNWVKNARAAGQVTLSRGEKSETVTVTQVGPVESAPILKKYINIETFARPYFDLEPDAPIEIFIAEAWKHPVFKVGDSVD